MVRIGARQRAGSGSRDGQPPVVSVGGQVTQTTRGQCNALQYNTSRRQAGEESESKQRPFSRTCRLCQPRRDRNRPSDAWRESRHNNGRQPRSTGRNNGLVKGAGPITAWRNFLGGPFHNGPFSHSHGPRVQLGPKPQESQTYTQRIKIGAIELSSVRRDSGIALPPLGTA